MYVSVFLQDFKIDTRVNACQLDWKLPLDQILFKTCDIVSVVEAGRYFNIL